MPDITAMLARLGQHLPEGEAKILVNLGLLALGLWYVWRDLRGRPSDDGGDPPEGEGG